MPKKKKVISDYSNQVYLEMTSKSSTRAFNEITYLNEHWEEMKDFFNF